MLSALLAAARPKLRHLALVAVASLLVVTSTAQAAPGTEDREFVEKVAQLQAIQSLDQMIADIGWRLGRANIDLCPAHFAGTGLGLHRISQYLGAYRAAAMTAFGLSVEYPAVLTVSEGSPAAASGIRRGDLIIAINGRSLQQGADTAAKASYEATDADMTKLETLAPGHVARIDIERAGARLSVELVPAETCASRFELAPGAELNANSNGTVVQIEGGLLRAIDSVDDLALVMAHELAHNVLKHNQEIEAEHLPTGLAAIFSSGGKKLRDLEREADRYSIFMNARAGFRYEQAGEFWASLTKRGGLAALWATTHPNAANRRRNAEAAIKDVKTLLSQNLPLVP